MEKIKNGAALWILVAFAFCTGFALDQSHLLSEITAVDVDFDLDSNQILGVGNLELGDGTARYVHFAEIGAGDGFSIVFDGTGVGDANYLYIRGGAGNPSAQSNLFRITRDTGSTNAYGSLDVATSVTVGNGLTVSAGGVDLPDDTVDSGEVSFDYAISGSKGGDATNLTCTDCVTLTGATTGNYAISGSENGSATGLACTNCVSLLSETDGYYASSSSEAGPAIDLDCNDCVALTSETVGGYAVGDAEEGDALNSLACSGDSTCTVTEIRSSTGILGVSGYGYGMNFYIDTDSNSNDDYTFYSDGNNITSINGDSGTFYMDGDLTVSGGRTTAAEFCANDYDVCANPLNDGWLHIRNKASTAYKGITAASIHSNEGISIAAGGVVVEDVYIMDGANNGIKLGDGGLTGAHGILFDDNAVSGGGVQLVWRTSPNQILIEPVSDGSDGADRFRYDRDDDTFYFGQRIGIGSTGGSGYNVHVTGNVRVTGNVVAGSELNIGRTSPMAGYDLSLTGDMRVTNDIMINGDDIDGDYYINLAGTKFASSCAATSVGAIRFDRSECYTDIWSQKFRRVELEACRQTSEGGAYDWYEVKVWSMYDDACS